MAAVFLKLLNLSISASWLVLAVLVLRLVSKRSPKWMNVLLWGISFVTHSRPFGQAYGRTPCFPPLGLLCTMGSREIRE